MPPGSARTDALNPYVGPANGSPLITSLRASAGQDSGPQILFRFQRLSETHPPSLSRKTHS